MNIFASKNWASTHHEVSVSYNPNVWSLIRETYDDESSTLFGVVDANDGASFGFDLICPEPGDHYEYEFGEAEYFARLFNVDNSVKQIKRFSLPISGNAFKCTAYRFNNPNYGHQNLVRGMYIGAVNVIGVSMAWAHGPDLHSEVSLPPKLQYFVDNLRLGDAATA